MSLLTQFPVLTRRRAVGLGGASLAVAVMGRPDATAAADQTHLEANKEVVWRLFEVGFNRRDTAALYAVIAPGYVDLGPGASQILGLAGMPLTSEEFDALLPGVTATVEGILAEGDLVAARVSWRGPHPPAGRHIAGRTMHFFRLDDGQIVEEWSVGWEWLPRA